ncbi:MAG: DUF3426 domain-containing protein [Rhodoferax sp.]|uniref:zinc-ribbon and DUF3426 domain-containing protein n=1 Tax=Rhodoferax sp. TaxID=50421 RepID=UPI0026177197|nr:DUF3426 domain-containing protein [Rhodoferax sp.]MDD2880164.1 DUF3426 domain-containing protein [Rhodoferax sp.]
MSLLTRCPVCTTLYRVVPDQLRISEGWVKCGQCGDIFDASQYLIEADIDPEPQHGAAVEPSPMLDVGALHDSTEDVEAPAPTDIDATDSSAPSAPDSYVDSDGHFASEMTTAAEVGIDSDWSYELGDGLDQDDVPAGEAPMSALADGDSASQLEPDSAPAPQFEPNQVRWDDAPPTNSTTTLATSAALPDDVLVTFMQGAKQTLFWQQPLVRVVLVLVSLALGLTLSGQWVYLERDRLAAQQPELKPMLQAFCRVTNCEVQPLKRIESLTVDSVGFHQLGKETYRLTFTVKNSSQLPLAMPYVELALTDAQDRPVYRRVFSSNDLGVAGTEIAAGADWSADVALRVNTEALAQRVFGYRLLVFYP